MSHVDYSPRRFALASLMIATLLCGCTQQYNHRFDKFDSFGNGKLTVTTDPPGAQVWAKASYKIDSTLRAGNRRHTHTLGPGDIAHDLQDWTLIGTTPVSDFSILTSGKSVDRKLGSTAHVDLLLRQLSLRIEKQGYETQLLENVFPRGDGTRLDFALTPVATEAGAATTQAADD